MSNENSEEVDLEFTQRMRRKLISKMTADDKMPEDTKDRSILLQALDGMDRQSLTKIKIKSDEGMNSQKALAAEAIANLFLNPNLRKSRQAVEGQTRVISADLPSDLPEATFIEGELAPIGTADNYESFMTRVKANPQD